MVGAAAATAATASAVVSTLAFVLIPRACTRRRYESDNAVVSHMTATNNMAYKRGGAIHNVYGTNFRVTDSELSDNYAGQYGGAIFERDNSGNSYYDRVSFHRNRAHSDGHIISGFGVTQYFRQCTAYLSGNELASRWRNSSARAFPSEPHLKSLTVTHLTEPSAGVDRATINKF